jgi:5'-phosphate synthase pdxT subunit
VAGNNSKELKIGILALQGDFHKHQERFIELKLENISIKTLLIKKPELLDAIDALVIPGGESTTLLKLMSEEFKNKIKNFTENNKKIFGTCAGSILLANQVNNPEQESFNLIDIEVTRNAYGRQNDSFIAKNLEIKTLNEKSINEVIFIRAPKISKTGEDIDILSSYNDSPVLVRNKNIMVATFHPELSSENDDFYNFLLEFFLD